MQRTFVLAAFVILLLSFSICMGQEHQAPVPERYAHGAGQSALIPEADIAALEVQLQQPRGGDGRPAVENRRALKNIVRKGLELIEKSPDSLNRFRVLGIVFQCQKRLLAIDNSEINRKAVFEACERMIQAPDEYAEDRLDADLLLSEKEMSEKNATMDERAKALAGLIERYRGTKAEAKSLLMAALIVQQLDAPELEGEITYALDERFSDDPKVIEFRREHLRISRLDVTVKGRFRRIDGAELSFPADAMGHMSLMVFWSKNKPSLDGYLESIKLELAKYSGLIKTYSFNVDDLPDAGASILSERGLDWAVMHLPGGRGNQAYQTYAQGDPVAVLLNEYGISVIRPEIVSGRMDMLDPARISDARYTAQLQSLFIGDFLAGSDEGSAPGRDIASSVQAIRDCFVQAPLRYRLTQEEALASYRKAAELCNDAIQRHPKDSGIQLVRNCKLIALMGLWRLSFDQGCLEQAVSEAKTALASELPDGADAVPRFYLAKDALRRGDGKAESVVSGYLEACGGDKAPASALAAACLLAIEAKSREMFEDCRGRYLAKHADNPAFYDFTAFLLDRHHQHRIMKANHMLRERSSRGYIVAHGYPLPTNSLPDIELTALDGTKLKLPKDTNGKLTYLLFVEPPAGATNDFPADLDSRGKPVRSDCLRSVMGFADSLTKSHVNKDINFVAAFLTDDAEHVRYLVATNGWTCQAAMVPGGLKNPMVRQFGVFSADKVPHIFLLRRDGTIAWNSSSLRYKNEFGFPFAILLGMKVQVEVCEVETAYEALAKGDYKEAARIFAGPFPPGEPDRFGWAGPRCYGKALAHMGLKDWNSALETIDAAVMQHKRMHYRGREPHRIEDWPAVLADLKIDPPCDVLSELWSTKVIILEKLDRKEEAAALRKSAEAPSREEHSNIYKTFHERLKALRLNAK